MVTPCVAKCTLDSLTGVCIGCGRTYEEIQDWCGYTDEQRMEIMKKLGYGKRMGREERLRRYERG
jgi:predicted Fe-S protein YdhL (DUF1289 family)